MEVILKIKLKPATTINTWYCSPHYQDIYFEVIDRGDNFYTVRSPLAYSDRVIFKSDCVLTEKTTFNKTLIKRIDTLFEQRLQAKTGWGRNDVLHMYRECVTEAALEMLD